MGNTPTTEDSLDALWKAAENAARRDDVLGVLDAWKALAEKKVWQIYARIGELYERGAPGLQADLGQALHWYRKAIFEADDAVAHVGLARAHYFGRGAERNPNLARKHFEKAYAQGSPDAALYLGIMFYEGHGVTPDRERAREFLSYAASRGYFFAHFKLARIALDEGHILRFLHLCVKGWILGFSLLKKNEDDPRLLGIERSVYRHFRRMA